MKHIFKVFLLLLVVHSGYGQSKTYLSKPGGTVLSTDTAGILQSKGVFYLSQFGVISDANLAKGSTQYGTDQTTKIQTVLNKIGANGGGEVVCDVKASATQIVLNKNTILRGLDKSYGFIQRPNSNKPFVVNANRRGMQTVSGVVSAAPMLDSNITVENITLNGSGVVSGNYGQAKTSLQGWTIIMRLSGVSGLTLRNIHFINPRTFCLFVNNAENSVWESLESDVETNSAYGNLDGFKVVGPYRNFYHNRLFGTSFDDLWSLDPNDGFQPDDVNGNIGDGPNYDPSASYGAITDGFVLNTYLNNTGTGCRILSIDQTIDRVVIDGVTGNINGPGLPFIIDNYTTGSQDPSNFYHAVGSTLGGNIGKVTIKNVDVSGGWIGIGGQIYVGCKAEMLDIHLNRNDFGAPTPSIRVSTTGNIRNLKVSTNSVTTSTQPLIQNDGGTIGELDINNSKYDRADAAATIAPIFRQVSGSVGIIRVNGVTMRKAGPVIDWNGGTIGKVVGVNVVMDNTSTPFINANSNTLPELVLSNYSGTLNTLGTISSRKGDAFVKADTSSTGFLEMQLLNGLLGYWKLDETSGNFLDGSGNNRNLTRVNGVTTVAGKVGNAANFVSTSSQYLTGPTSIYKNTDMTIAGFFKINTGVTGVQALIFKGITPNSDYEFGLYYDATAALLKFNVFNGNILEVTSPITLGDYVFIEAKISPANGMTLKVGSAAPVGIGFSGAIFNGAAPLTIGAVNNTYFLNGAADNVAIWDRALTTEEDTYIYNSGAGRSLTFSETPSSQTVAGIQGTLVARKVPVAAATDSLTSSNITVNASGKISIGAADSTAMLTVTDPTGTGNVFTAMFSANPATTGINGSNILFLNNLQGTNRKNLIGLGGTGSLDWVMGNDLNGTGLRDFHITTTGGSSRSAFFIDTSGFINLRPTFGGVRPFPKSGLSVEGNVGIGLGYANTYAAPVNGMIVQGYAGFGTFTPTAQLHVVGSTLLNGAATVTGAFTTSTSQTFLTTTEPTDPSPGSSVQWFDGTNQKIKKNVGGTVTTLVIF